MRAAAGRPAGQERAAPIGRSALKPYLCGPFWRAASFARVSWSSAFFSTISADLLAVALSLSASSHSSLLFRRSTCKDCAPNFAPNSALLVCAQLDLLGSTTATSPCNSC